MPVNAKFEIIGAPFGFAGKSGGSAEAPEFLRAHGLNMKIKQRNSKWGANIADAGDVAVSNDIYTLIESGDHEKAVQLYCNSLYNKVNQSFKSKHKPVVIGGDHSISIGTISAAASFLRQHYQSDRLGVIWVDAHADLNDRDKGNIHGKVVASLLGYGPHESLKTVGGYSPKTMPSNVIYIGLNDLMPNEYKLIAENNILAYGMDQVETLGIDKIMGDVMTRLEQSMDAIFLSFDMDVCDGGTFRGFSVPEVGGLTAREAIHIVHRISQSPKFIGADIVEFSPENDVFHNTCPLAIKLIDVLWGYRL